MIAEGISESGSEKRRRGRPRSRVRLIADNLERYGFTSDCGCERSRTNKAYRAAATEPALRVLTAEEQVVLLGMDRERYMSGGLLPRGWSSAALEIGRLLEGIGADDQTARGYLLVAVNARRSGVSWRMIRAHFRSLRLGERCGNTRSLVSELAKTIDRYCSRLPATTDQMIADAARVLCRIVSERTAAEPGSPAANDLAICD
jgi:hypothetical protein